MDINSSKLPHGKKHVLESRIQDIEAAMNTPDFWNDKDRAQKQIAELGELKNAIAGVGKYDVGNAVVTIFSGAGGDDAEDFSGMLARMYFAYCANKGWDTATLHQNENNHGGYRNITFEILGKGAYGILKGESGVHRLVRISPFNAKKLRHTSFSMVEVIPKFTGVKEVDIPDRDIKFEFARSSGPGGQNVNKRDTAVRAVHIPTGLSVHVETERSQAQNREKAVEVLAGKLYKKMEEDQKKQEMGLSVSKTTEIEWGNQIRSYVLHPYKMVKDHRTNVEVRDVDSVLKDGAIDEFIEAERDV